MKSAGTKYAKTGYVYLIECTFTGLVKIGWALDPSSRLRDLQCGSASPLKLVGVRAAHGPAEERWWHAHFKGKRVRGEFFSLDREDVERLLTYKDKNFHSLEDVFSVHLMPFFGTEPKRRVMCHAIEIASKNVAMFVAINRLVTEFASGPHTGPIGEAVKTLTESPASGTFYGNIERCWREAGDVFEMDASEAAALSAGLLEARGEEGSFDLQDIVVLDHLRVEEAA